MEKKDLTGQTQNAFEVAGSHGSIRVDPKTGNVIRADSCDCEECRVYGDYTTIDCFDLDEFRAVYGDNQGCADILDIGYWSLGGIYEPPVISHRRNTFALREMNDVCPHGDHKANPCCVGGGPLSCKDCFGENAVKKDSDGLEERGGGLFTRFHDALMDDDEPWERKGDRLLWSYERADDKGKALIDDIFITLCGWRLKTLIETTQKLTKDSQ